MSRPVAKVVMTPEMEEKFESELYWCIEKLQNSLQSGKLSKKQSESTMKSLNVLMGKSSIVKKRQTMRVLFGDYRAKMAEEEKKLFKSNLKITYEAIKPHKNSKFLRKSEPLNTNSNCEELSNEISKIQIGNNSPPKTEITKNTFKFVPSDGSFKFNFGNNSS